jgi:hypothetical protein
MARGRLGRLIAFGSALELSARRCQLLKERSWMREARLQARA